MGILYVDGKKVLGGGSLHTVNVTNGSGTIIYQVVNGVCFIRLNNVSCPASTTIAGYDKVPKSSFGGVVVNGYQHVIWVDALGIQVGSYAISGCYDFFSYPVVDDWYEPTT